MQEPWFLWVAYNAPHGPRHHAPDDLHRRPYTEGDDVFMYGTMVEAMDTEIGRLLGSIEPRILENTTIIFVGDNGTPVEKFGDKLPPELRAAHAAAKERLG